MLIEQVYLSEDESSNPLIHHLLAQNVDGLVHNPRIRWRPCGKRVLQLFLTEEVFFSYLHHDRASLGPLTRFSPYLRNRVDHLFVSGLS